MEPYLFEHISSDPVLRNLEAFRYSGEWVAGRRACQSLLRYAASHGRRGDMLRQYVVELLLDSPNAAKLIQRSSLSAPYLEFDMDVLYDTYFDFDWLAHCKQHGQPPFPAPEEGEPVPQWLKPMMEADSHLALAKAVEAFYATYNDRGEARFRAFRWNDGTLSGINSPERQSFEQLAGLTHQKELLLDNARAFLAGAPAHNVLLVGSSGTGKSSCVKATLTQFGEEGLRLVELPKQQVHQLPRLMEALRDKRCKYIVYIDDLSFEEVDEGYKALKVALEGQVEEKLPHVLIYVTSNRRNLVKETWNDRESDQEIHENDSLHEKRSLSERFGLRLYFGVLSQKEYFDAVGLMLARCGIPFTDEIGAMASAWALTYNGRSGRTARQFVDDYITRNKN